LYGTLQKKKIESRKKRRLMKPKTDRRKPMAGTIELVHCRRSWKKERQLKTESRHNKTEKEKENQGQTEKPIRE